MKQIIKQIADKTHMPTLCPYKNLNKVREEIWKHILKAALERQGIYELEKTKIPANQGGKVFALKKKKERKKPSRNRVTTKAPWKEKEVESWPARLHRAEQCCCLHMAWHWTHAGP